MPFKYKKNTKEFSLMFETEHDIDWTLKEDSNQPEMMPFTAGVNLIRLPGFCAQITDPQTNIKSTNELWGYYDNSNTNTWRNTINFGDYYITQIQPFSNWNGLLHWDGSERTPTVLEWDEDNREWSRELLDDTEFPDPTDHTQNDPNKLTPSLIKAGNLPRLDRGPFWGFESPGKYKIQKVISNDEEVLKYYKAVTTNGTERWITLADYTKKASDFPTKRLPEKLFFEIQGAGGGGAGGLTPFTAKSITGLSTLATDHLRYSGCGGGGGGYCTLVVDISVLDEENTYLELVVGKGGSGGLAYSDTTFNCSPTAGVPAHSTLPTNKTAGNAGGLSQVSLVRNGNTQTLAVANGGNGGSYTVDIWVYYTGATTQRYQLLSNYQETYSPGAGGSAYVYKLPAVLNFESTSSDSINQHGSTLLALNSNRNFALENIAETYYDGDFKNVFQIDYLFHTIETGGDGGGYWDADNKTIVATHGKRSPNTIICTANILKSLGSSSVPSPLLGKNLTDIYSYEYYTTSRSDLEIITRAAREKFMNNILATPNDWDSGIASEWQSLVQIINSKNGGAFSNISIHNTSNNSNVSTYFYKATGGGASVLGKGGDAENILYWVATDNVTYSKEIANSQTRNPGIGGGGSGGMASPYGYNVQTRSKVSGQLRYIAASTIAKNYPDLVKPTNGQDGGDGAIRIYY